LIDIILAAKFWPLTACYLPWQLVLWPTANGSRHEIQLGYNEPYMPMFTASNRWVLILLNRIKAPWLLAMSAIRLNKTSSYPFALMFSKIF
jgi:hypothetical protein